MMENISLDTVTLKNALRLMMEGSEYHTFKEVAETLEMPRSTFQSSLDNNAIRVRDLQKIVHLLGYELTLVKK
ncbi:hypothetical protein [Bacillus sp. SJS]|uniref:hypothetical protein n=1 Tax=Bacillus sp. SJS TaxID=1423321 RepID=UPI0004DCDBD3|nr:hypothetical protein [Bacillus sp. SJS]KZZ82520.1 hypothetical protein AS29_020735 [Bacillus sp. SJS]